ncbi:guanine rab-3a nucleotide exchange factor, partial [Mytilus galloprovincialis]
LMERKDGYLSRVYMEDILPCLNFANTKIAAVCDYYTYIRYIQQGLVKNEDKEVFYELVRLRKKMALTRLGYS